MYVSGWYEYERGTTVYSGRPTSWVGKVALMYPSDYGYATSGGNTTNREQCLMQTLYNWYKTTITYCKSNDWLYDNTNDQWTLTPYSSYSESSAMMTTTGSVGSGDLFEAFEFRPSLYLKSDIQISGGTGIESNPYTVSN